MQTPSYSCPVCGAKLGESDHIFGSAYVCLTCKTAIMPHVESASSDDHPPAGLLVAPVLALIILIGVMLFTGSGA